MYSGIPCLRSGVLGDDLVTVKNTTNITDFKPEQTQLGSNDIIHLQNLLIGLILAPWRRVDG